MNNGPVPVPLAKCQTLNEIIARLAWEVEQPNSHPLELYFPLIKAIGRRLYGPNRGPQEMRIINMLPADAREGADQQRDEVRHG